VTAKTTRKERYTPKTADGRPSAFSARLYSRFRRAWFTSKDVDLTLYVGYESTVQGGDVDRFKADPVGIAMKIYGRNTWLSLHNYTEDELLGMRAFFLNAFDAALPVARSLDLVAQAEYDTGAVEVSPRLFRLSPILVIRDKVEPKLAELPAPTDNMKEINNGASHQNGSGDSSPQATH